MKTELYIDITPADMKANDISNSSSGQVIDELAVACGEWDSNTMFENTFDYQPFQPYSFDYEADLFAHTKTVDDFNKLGTTLCAPEMMIFYKAETIGNLQAGAYCALNDPEAWGELLKAWTDELQSNQTDGPSKEYNAELEKEQESYNDDQYKEWLNGDYRNWPGIVRTIAKHYIGDRDAGDYNNKTDIYTFTVTPEIAHELACNCYEDDCKDYTTAEQIKAWLLLSIAGDGASIRAKRKAESDKRRAEYQKEKAYKEERAIREAEARKAKLEAMIINN